MTPERGVHTGRTPLDPEQAVPDELDPAAFVQRLEALDPDERLRVAARIVRELATSRRRAIELDGAAETVAEVRARNRELTAQNMRLFDDMTTARNDAARYRRALAEYVPTVPVDVVDPAADHPCSHCGARIGLWGDGAWHHQGSGRVQCDDNPLLLATPSLRAV